MKMLCKTNIWKMHHFINKKTLCVSLYLLALGTILKQTIEHICLIRTEICCEERRKPKIYNN